MKRNMQRIKSRISMYEAKGYQAREAYDMEQYHTNMQYAEHWKRELSRIT